MLKAQSIADQAAKFIEELIVSGKLKPGEKIKEQETSLQLGISRLPVREAFKILEAEGLVRKEPRRGMFVSRVETKDIWEIYTLKMALYTLAVTLSVDKMTDRDIRRLERIVRAMERIAESQEPNIVKYQDLNDEFHLTTVDVAGHGRLKRTIESLNNQIRRISYLSLSTNREHLSQSCAFHRKIMDAMARKDVAAAEELTRGHIAKGLEMLKKTKEQEGAG